MTEILLETLQINNLLFSRDCSSLIRLLFPKYLRTEATCWATAWCSSPLNASSLTFRYITPVIPVLSLIPVTKQYWKCWWSMSVCSTAQINIKAAIKNPHQAGASLFLMKLINALVFRRLGKEKEKRNKNKKHAASLTGHIAASRNSGILPHPLSNHKK